MHAIDDSLWKVKIEIENLQNEKRIFLKNN